MRLVLGLFHLSAWQNFCLLHNIPVDYFSSLWCLLLYFFRVNLVQSIIIIIIIISSSSTIIIIVIIIIIIIIIIILHFENFSRQR